jgi:hypothetical protein
MCYAVEIILHVGEFTEYKTANKYMALNLSRPKLLV